MSTALAPSRALPRARALRRAAIVGAATAAAVLSFAGPALAHITVSPASAPAGSAVVLTFHVPNEEARADTVKLDMRIPTDHPIAQLLVEPVPGWSVSVRTITLAKPVVSDDGTFSQAVSEVIWSGGQILPGQFQDFTISADPMPAGVRALAFKAIQSYSNGDVVRWIDLPQSGQPPPAHPAPTVTLTPDAAPAPAPAPAISGARASSSPDGLSRALAAAGLLVALLAGLLALTAARRVRRLTAGIGAGAGAAAASDRAGTHNGQPSDLVPADSKASVRRDQAPVSTKASSRRNQSRRRG